MTYIINSTSFTNRKATTMNNNSGSALTDYQVPITVTYAVAMKADYGDIRFAYPNGTNIPYWLESKTNSVTALFWIKCDLPYYGASPTGDNIVYIYYGNPNLTSISSIPNTFIREISNVVGAWDFNDNAYDLSSKGNNLTVSNASYVTGAFGTKGLSFDGSITSYVQNLSISSFGLGTNTTFTAWIKPTTITGGFSCNIHNNDGGAGRCIMFLYDHGLFIGVNKDGCLFADTSANGSSWTNTTNTPAGVIVAGNSYFIAIVVRDNVAIDYYVNGSLIHTTTITNSAIYNKTAFGIGTISSWPGAGFIGTIDEPRIYNNKLSSEEIASIANNRGYVTTNYAGKELVHKYVTASPTVSIGTEQVPTGITATSMTIAKSENPCRTGICTVTIDVTWTNNGLVPESFIPSITANGTPVVVTPPLTDVTANPSGTVSQRFTMSNIPANIYSICPNPN